MSNSRWDQRDTLTPYLVAVSLTGRRRYIKSRRLISRASTPLLFERRNFLFQLVALHLYLHQIRRQSIDRGLLLFEFGAQRSYLYAGALQLGAGTGQFLFQTRNFGAQVFRLLLAAPRQQYQRQCGDTDEFPPMHHMPILYTQNSESGGAVRRRRG